MARHLVCLTFDFDAIANWLARGLTTPTPVSRGEFGVVGAGRLLTLLHDRGIAATWFVPGHTLETYPDMAERILAAGQEIGQHGYSHQPPATLTREEEEVALVRCNDIIRRLSGAPAQGYRSPAWDLSPHTVSLLLEHGFRYDSSLMGDDYQPYRCRTGRRVSLDRPAQFGQRTPLIEMPIELGARRLAALRVRARTNLHPAGAPARGRRPGRLARRVPLYGAHHGVGRAHLYLSPAGDRSRSPHADAGESDRPLSPLGATFSTLGEAAAEFTARSPFSPSH